MNRYEIFRILKELNGFVDKAELLRNVNARGYNLTKEAFKVSISRLRKANMIQDLDGKIKWNDPIESQRETLLKALEGKTIQELKNELVLNQALSNVMMNKNNIKKLKEMLI